MMKKLLLIIISLFLLTGCYNYKELNDLAIASALGIDYKNGKYFISVQIMNLETEGNNQKQSSSIYTGEGGSIAQAINNINLAYPKILYIGQLELIILGKDVINNNIEDVFDYFIRDPEAVLEFYVLASNDNQAYDILNQKQASEQFPAKGIVSIIETSSEKNGTIISTTFEEFIAKYLEKGTTPLLTNIYVHEEPSSDSKELQNTNTLSLNDTLVFNDKKVIAKLNQNQVLIYNFLKNNTISFMKEISYHEKPLILELNNTKASITTELINDKLNIEIKVKASGEIAEMKSKDLTRDSSVLKEISDISSTKIQNEINQFINFCKTNNIDILEIKNQIYKKYNSSYNKYKNINIYDIANINVDVNISIYNSGNSYKGAVK